MDFIPCGNGILALSTQAANKNQKKWYVRNPEDGTRKT
jgi:hypothetical protein